MSDSPKHILVIRLSALGDVAMTVPVLRAINHNHPDVKLTVLTRPFFKPLFKELHNTDVFEIDVYGTHKGIFGLRKLAKEVKKLNIDAIADLHNVLRTKILKIWLSGFTYHQINKGRKEKKALVKGNTFKQLKSTHERYADVFRKLGLPIDLSIVAFSQNSALNDTNKNFVGSYQSIVGVAPFAAFKGKTYPLHLMTEVILTLSKENKVVLFGGKGKEAKLLEEIAEKHDNVVSCAGKLSFDNELNLISNLNLMISMDSGNAHLAANYNVPVITLWGVTHPFAGFYPFHQNPDNALLADRTRFPKIPTSIYGNNYPDGYEEAISTITPEEIVRKAESLLS